VNTLEAPEAHTLKALEDTVAVDPLFQKTSALFDEGGASGLLLNNLSVHRGCNICFDSEEVPEYGDAGVDDDEAPIDGIVVDLSSIAQTIELAQRSAVDATRITPAVGVIEDLLHGLTGGNVASTAAAAKAVADGTAGVSLFDFASGDGIQFAEYDDAQSDDDDAAPYDDTGGFGAGFEDDGVDFADDFNPNQGYSNRGPDGEELDMEGDAGLEWVVNSGMGGKMAWAGPSHWRFKAPPSKAAGKSGDKSADGDDGEQKPKKREKGELTFDFENPGEPDEARFTLAATIEELQLVAAPTQVDTLLPPDLGYDASQLVKLSLRPNAGVGTLSVNFGAPDVSGGGDDGGMGFDGDGGDFGGGFDGDDGFGGGFDGDGDAGFDDPSADTPEGMVGLVAAPRRCEKIQVNYARQTKEVNVKELKCTLWENINDDGICPADEGTGSHSFNQLLRKFPEDNLAGATEDISVHMAFICMLHLANENGLKITDRPGLDDLDISNLPGAIAAH
jgi:condensin complex subunit 2